MRIGEPMGQDEIREYRRQQALERRKSERRERLGKVVKFFVLVFIFIFVFVFYQNGFNFKFDFKFDKINFNFDFLKKKDSSGDPGEETKRTESDLKGKFIAYVPMDDRSIHTTRMIYLAESAGYDLKMPDGKSYKTYLTSGENSYAGYNTKYGNPSKIASWLLDMEDAGCDYYILSVDQLFSGGIAGSQYLSDKDFSMYDKGPEAAQRALNKILSNKKNHVYLIDSITGLSATAGFMDFTEEDEKLLREFTSKPRLDASELTISKIAENYILDPEGKSYTTELNLDKLNKYLAARERKLTYSSSLIEAISKLKNPENVYLFYGIDDSGNSGNNIQKNDIAFIRDQVKSLSNETLIKDGLSSLTEEVFAKMLMDSLDQEVRVKVRYYGNSNQTVAGTGVAYTSFTNDLIKEIGGAVVDDQPNLEVLVYTKNEASTRDESSKKLLSQYLANIGSRIPTIIISDADYKEDSQLINYLIDYSATEIPMGYMIGYSSYNGYRDSSRIALSQGFARYLYLTQLGKNKTSNKGFLKSISYEFIEDIAYLPSSRTSTDLREVEALMDERIKKITTNLSSSNYITNLLQYNEKGIKEVSTYGYKFPWNRPTEIDFDVSVADCDKYKDLKIPSEVVVKEPEKQES